MKKIIVICLLVLSSTTLFAQGNLARGANQLNAGVGFSGWGLPVYIGFDHGFRENVTLGAEASFRGYRERIIGINYRHNIIGLSGNGNYHFNQLLDLDEEWDVYAGLNLGFYIWSSPSAYPGANSSGLGLGAQLGGRYYFTSRTALNLEFGGGNAFSGGKFGITHKF
jgi:outer membrane immunogenic protein